MSFSIISRPEQVLRQVTLLEVANEAAYRLEGSHYDEPKVLRTDFGTNWQVGQALRRKVLALGQGASKSQEKRLTTQKVWSGERRQLTDRLGMGEGIPSTLDEQRERKHE